ncbi:alanine racemase [Bizionia psychrotolerans]|uniref:alanine racemase n=1 Tax=Bizionia psychrotolerans TaxID=1492901 RepID=UPI000650937C|nr:alanine racemase [Bizionia psychrotolerans]
MEKVHETVLEIDLNALTHNFQYLKSRIKPQTKILAVVKAFAYGSDASEIAAHLQKLDVDYFAVAYTQEGIALRDSGIKTPILVLHPQSVNFKTLIDRCLEPSIYSHHMLTEFIKITEEEKQTNYPVHIKFNTGLNRLGFDPVDVSEIVSTLKNTKSVQAKSIFSHLAASEDLNEKLFTEKQIATFKTISKTFKESIGYKPMLHLCNTSGVLNYPEAHFDMVRVGIGLYGFGNSEKEDVYFTPIATLKSIISQIHTIEAGESVGYNRAFKGANKTRSATIPIGHADGIGRQYGNGKGFVTIHNKQAPIIGNVCMDMIMVDVSDIDCQEGDEVIIFGKNPTANKLAQTTKSISYEIITAISQRVKRVFLNN